MTDLERELGRFDHMDFLRCVESGIIRTAGGWIKEEGDIDAGTYEAGRYKGARAVMSIVCGSPEPAYVEVFDESPVRDLLQRLEPELREAFGECVPLAMLEAAAEKRRAARYVAVPLGVLEGAALTALFSYACTWRSGLERLRLGPARPQILWTPALRRWVRGDLRMLIRMRAAGRENESAEARAKAVRVLAHARNLAIGAGVVLREISEMVLKENPSDALRAKAEGAAKLAATCEKLTDR